MSTGGEPVSRFLFLTFDGGGNQPPAIGIAQALRNHGHEVVFAGYATQRRRFTASGFAFVVLERSQAAMDKAASAGGWQALLEAVLVCAPQVDEVPEAVTRARADVVVVDCMMFAALAACERARLPAAVLAHSPPGALLRADRILARRVPQPLNELRAAIGLSGVELLQDTWRGMPILCASIPELDPASDEATPVLEYVGPIFEQMAPSGWRAPWPSDEVRPLVLVSFSTSVAQDPDSSRIRRTLAGLATRPWRVLVTSSGADLSGAEVPDNAVVMRSLPHSEIMGFVAATVTHAGHGTIAASLAYGVPLVCLPHPVIADQLPLAEQVQRLGAGRALDGEFASGADIAAAVDEVLTNESYTAAARRLQARIGDFPGALAAVAPLQRLALAGGARRHSPPDESSWPDC